ncbi:MAG: conjugal transfer protein TraF [Chromatiales bacterium]|nr:conjugal transfer protein TraF [Chromatiales bacterium]
MNKLRIAMGAVLLASYGIAQAAPFNSYDPRSMAMGGAGVAVGNAGTASMFNPALLAASHDKDRFAILIPVAGARAYDPDDFSDAVDNFDDTTLDTLDTAISGFTDGTPAQTLAIRDAIDGVDAELIKIGSRPIQAELGAGVVVGVPGRKLGVGFFATGTAVIGGVINYDDNQVFADFNQDLTNWDACYATPSAELCADENFTYMTVDYDGTTLDGSVDFETDVNMQSSVDVRGLIIRETGISLAREFTIAGSSFSVGITPKSVKATVLDYTARVEESDEDDFDGDDYTKDYSHFNFDIGFAKDYANGWRTGLVVKNVLSQEYETYQNGVATGNSIKTKPQVRLGLSHQAETYTLAADLDLTENDPVGYEGKSRYLAMGAEFNAWNWAQLRAGYRANLSDSDRNVWSAGLGLSPFGVHLDIAVSGSSNEYGAAMQLGYRF